jgi:hypothetical protein
MRTRKQKTIDGKSYEKVDTSRFFRVKARSVKKALDKLQFIHSLEVRDMFRSLTVDSLLADKREARVNLSYRVAVEQEVAFQVKTTIPTEFKETGSYGFGYPQFTPCNFIERLQLVTQVVPTIGWID